ICASAQPLTVELDCMPTTSSTNCATESIGVYPGCASPYHTLPDVYYSFTSPNTASGDVSLNITDITANGTTFAVYDGCGGSQVACGYDYTSGTNEPLDLEPNTAYVLQVFNSAGNTGTFDLCLSE